MSKSVVLEDWHLQTVSRAQFCGSPHGATRCATSITRVPRDRLACAHKANIVAETLTHYRGLKTKLHSCRAQFFGSLHGYTRGAILIRRVPKDRFACAYKDNIFAEILTPYGGLKQPKDKAPFMKLGEQNLKHLLRRMVLLHFTRHRLEKGIHVLKRNTALNHKDC